MDTKATPADIIYARSLQLKGEIVTLGVINPTTTEVPAKPPAKPPITDEPYLETSSPADRGLTDSEYEAARALVADINQYVEEGSENEFYLEPRWMDANGFVYRLRDGWAQSTIDIVIEADLDKYRDAVHETKLNPYDAINVYRGQSPKGRA